MGRLDLVWAECGFGWIKLNFFFVIIFKESLFQEFNC